MGKGVDVNTKDENGNTALMLSAFKGHIECGKYLIEKGVDTNEKNQWGSTALMFSAWQGHLDCVKFLLQQGAKNKKNPLFLRAYQGYLDWLESPAEQIYNLCTIL